MSKVLAACLLMAAQTYNVPPAVLVGIYNVEGGRVGQQVRNTNGTYDLGPMQINTLWMDELSKFWQVDRATAKKWVRDDPCTNMGVSAWILRKHLNETGSLPKAIAQYHSRTPHLGSNYRRKVVKAMERKGLLRPSVTQQASTSAPSMRATSTDRFGKQAKRSAPSGTTGLQGAMQTARVTTPADPVYQGGKPLTRTPLEKVGMNSIIVHNPVVRYTD